jgi:RimJ/RimL family protein N-acetyltransferase
MQVFLETERLILRRFTTTDVDNLVRLDGDPGVMRFLNGGKPTPRELIERETLPRLVREYERWAGYGSWAAVEKASGTFLGWFALRPTEAGRPGEAELGYRLRTAAWGKGYATEGSRALVRKGFSELGMQRVIAKTMTVNVGSRRVLEKAGLSFVRTFYEDWPEPIEGAEQGDVEYALDRSDWERGEAATREAG